MNKTQATKQAKSESHLQDISGQWMIMTWDNDCKAWRDSYPRPYLQACAAMRDWRADRELELLAMVFCYSCEVDVVPEEDRRGCGCHCPDCQTAL